LALSPGTFAGMPLPTVEIGDLSWAPRIGLVLRWMIRFIGFTNFLLLLLQLPVRLIALSTESSLLTPGTVDSVAAAERMKLSWYLILSAFMTAFTYPVIAHWVWHPNGWLHLYGFVDFAGGGVVHLLGGTSALVLTTWLGPRTGRMGQKVPYELRMSKNQVDMTYKALTGDPIWAMFGTLTLWISWFGFNGSSLYSITGSDGVLTSHVMMTTAISASAGSVTGLVMSINLEHGHVVTRYVTDCTLGGLVAVTAFAHLITVGESIIVGILAAATVMIVHAALEGVQIDDPVGAIPVHFSCGFLGIVSAGVFMDGRGECGFDESKCGLLHCGRVVRSVYQFMYDIDLNSHCDRHHLQCNCWALQ
jgi:ammonium transporter, Amt family